MLSSKICWHSLYPPEEELKEIGKVLESGCLTCGPRTEEFEELFAGFIGRKYAVAVSSGTAALQLVLTTILDSSRGKDVVLPSFTFIADAHAVVRTGGRPVFADLGTEGYTLTAKSISSLITEETAAVIGVDLFGFMAPWQELQEQYPHIVLIEDACQALGTEGAGRFGLASVFSFFPNKMIACGEGGMILTNDSLMAENVKRLRSQGRLLSDQPGIHSSVGYNFRMTEIQAVLGICQLKKITRLKECRNSLVNYYYKKIAPLGEMVESIIFPSDEHGWFSYPVIVKNPYDPIKILSAMNLRGIPAKLTYVPIHRQPPYIPLAPDVARRLPWTERIGGRVLSMPLHYRLQFSEIDYIISVLKEVLENDRMCLGNV